MKTSKAVVGNKKRPRHAYKLVLKL